MCFIRGENNLEIMFFTFGVLVVTVLKMLTSTRNKVTRSAILLGMMSGGTTKLNGQEFYIVAFISMFLFESLGSLFLS